MAQKIDPRELLQHALRPQYLRQTAPLAGLLEERVLELEQLGMEDVDTGVEMSAPRQYAFASLMHQKPPYFITSDDELLERRDVLEARYGLAIFSPFEAMLLLREDDGPPN
ncbi:MAG: hypothetical protein ACYDBB_14040 [Armatimonadota bacterium]